MVSELSNDEIQQAKVTSIFVKDYKNYGLYVDKSMQ